MKTKPQEKIASLIAKRELAVAFLKHHNNDISDLTPNHLKNSGNETDRQIYNDICSHPDWKEIILDIADYQIPDYLKFDIAPLAENNQYSWEPIQNINIKEELTSEQEAADPATKWNFQFDVSYLFTLLPYYDTGSSCYISSRAFAITDNQLTVQPDEINSDWVSYTEEISKADAITGSFDVDNPKDLVFYQVNDTLSLDEIEVSSVDEYKTLYKEKTNFFTRSQACDLLKISGKKQIVTVLLNGTQIGLDVYYFNKGQKVEWGASKLFDHNIGYTNIRSFSISVSEVLPNNTIEVVALISKSYLNTEFHYIYSLQTNLIKLVIDVSSKTFSLVSNQVLVGPVSLPGNIMLNNLEQHIYQANDFVYLDYISADDKLTVSAMQWDGTIYKQVWKDAYQISLPKFLSNYQQSLFYRNGDTFYLVHIVPKGFDKGPTHFYLEIYQRQNNGELSKTKTIPFFNEKSNPGGSYWNGIYTQNSLYLIQAGYRWTDNQRMAPALFFFKADEINSVVNLLGIQNVPHLTCGMLNLALCNYDIKAQTPTISSLTECLQPIAILDSPPISSMIDYAGGADHPSLTYSFQKQETSSKNVETKTERSKSDKLGAGFKFFGLKIGADISKKIEESSKKFHERQFQLTQDTEIVSEEQDMTVFLGMSYDIYEYPITIGGKPSGCFLYVVPSSQPVLSIDTGQDQYRKTSHQIGNLLSYPSQMPNDIQKKLYSNQFSINDSESYNATVSYSDLETETESTTTTTTVSKSLSLNFEFPIIEKVAPSLKAKLEESYTNEDINISSFTIENSFTLKIKIEKLHTNDATKSFKIIPYFYIDTSNILRCAYSVEVSSGGSGAPSFWKEYYKYPDFGMVMPFHTDNYKEDFRYLLSFDIETKPCELVKDLKKLDISVTVHNWSLVSGTYVVVGFYYAKELKKDPLKTDLIEIGRQTIELIKPRGSAVVSITWEHPYLIPIINLVPIYVIIDPDKVQDVMSRGNNFAQINYPLTCLNDKKAIESYLSENASS